MILLFVTSRILHVPHTILHVLHISYILILLRLSHTGTPTGHTTVGGSHQGFQQQRSCEAEASLEQLHQSTGKEQPFVQAPQHLAPLLSPTNTYKDKCEGAQK